MSIPNPSSSIEKSEPGGTAGQARQVAGSDGIDLLGLRPFSTLVRWGGFPYVFQAALLAFFIGLVVFSWGVATPAGVRTNLFAKTHLVTLLVWGVWWPVMIWAAVILGRVWCMVCPLELVSNVAERVARRLGLRQRSLPGWVAGGGLIVILYAVTHIVVGALHIDRVPAFTAWFLLSLMTLATVTGLVFKHRAYCRGFCPVGSLLSIYGRGGVLAVRPGGAAACRSCAGGECRAAANRDRLDARSCPSLLNPAAVDSNMDCLLCGQCIKSCHKANMRFLLRWPFHKGDARAYFTSWPLTLFVMVDSGFVISEWVEGSEFAESIFLAVPHGLAALAGWSAAADWIAGVWTVAVFPLLVWSLLGLVTRLVGMRGTLGQRWRRIALPAAAVVASIHMGRALAESISWSRYLPGALRDPAGVDTALAVTAGAQHPAPALLGAGILTVVSLALLFTGVLIAGREFRLAGSRGDC